LPARNGGLTLTRRTALPTNRGALVIDQQTVIIILVTAIVIAGLTVAAIKGLDHLRKVEANREATRILERAENDASTKIREAELEIKERSLQEKTKIEKELGADRDELRDRERQLDKRQETHDQQSDDLRKQEKIVESTQRRLAERLEDTNRRNEELAKLTDMQRQTLHELSGLSRDEATKRLMAMLDQELTQETGAVILRHEKQIKETCEEKSREILLTALQRYASAHTAEVTTSTVDIPNDDMKEIGRASCRERVWLKV
jgi:ribonuclease Y